MLSDGIAISKIDIWRGREKERDRRRERDKNIKREKKSYRRKKKEGQLRDSRSKLFSPFEFLDEMKFRQNNSDEIRQKFILKNSEKPF